MWRMIKLDPLESSAASIRNYTLQSVRGRSVANLERILTSGKVIRSERPI
jgi:hypothetical protein